MGERIELNPTAVRVDGYEGVRINVWDYGGEGPALMLAHCTGTHGRIWDPLVPALLARFHVYAYDTRGHGDSDKPRDPKSYRWDHSGMDLLAVIDALGLGAGVLAAGHSAGAAHICYAEMRRPGTFSRAVLLDPIIGPAETFRGPNPMAEKSRRRRNEFDNHDVAVRRFASKPPMNAWAPEALEAYVRFGTFEQADGRIRLKCPGEIEAAVYEGGGTSDVYEHLGELKLHVTLVVAENSHVRTLAELQRERFSSVDFKLIGDCSHFIPQEKPDEIAALILEALES